LYLEPKEKEKKFQQFRKIRNAAEMKIEAQRHLEAIKLYLRLKSLSDELTKFSTPRGIFLLENEVREIEEKLKEANAHHSLRTNVDPSRIFPVAVLFVLIVIGALLFRNYAGITGYAVVQEEKGYLDNLDLEFSANSSYSWFLGHSGDLKSVKISGSLSANAAAKVYLKKGNQSKLIFDSGQAEEGGIGGITGFAVKDKEDKEKDNGKGQDKKDETNQSTENESITDNLVINETNQNNNNELINQTITNESIIDNSIINETTSQTINETNQPIENESITNQSIINESINEPAINNPIIDKKIIINLSYNSGTAFDADDDGIETTAGVIDFTVEDTAFDWQIDESKLCTKWEVYNLESFGKTTVCNGNSDCCAFAGVLPSSSNWDDAFYNNYGKHGAGLENLIYAQVIFYNVSLEPENPYADIVTSNLTALSANYYSAYNYFNDKCAETCTGLTGYNEIFYELVIKVENGALKLDNITYSILERVATVNVNLNVKDSSGLINAILNIYAPNGSLVEGNQIEPDSYTIEVIPSDKVIEKVRFYGVNITKTLADSIGIDNVTDISKANIINVNISRVFALDSSKLNFSSATLTGVATASALYKCAEWVFNNEECTGNWVKIKDLVAGEEYNVTLVPGDPGFAEGNPLGNLSIRLVSPNADINVAKGEFFNFTVEVSCDKPHCGDVNVSLDPIVNDKKSINTEINKKAINKEGNNQLINKEINNNQNSLVGSPASPGYNAYAENLYPSDLSLSTSSLVLNTSTIDCSLKCGSLDQMGILLNANDKARYSVSSLSEISELACLRNLSNFSFGTDFILLFNFANSSSISLDESFDSASILGLCFSNSSDKYSGEYNFTTPEDMISFVTPAPISPVNNTVASITNSIYSNSGYNFLYLLCMPLFTSLANLRASSSVNLDLDTILLNASKSSCSSSFFRASSLASSDQFIQGNLSIDALNSSEIFSATLGIYNSPLFLISSNLSSCSALFCSLERNTSGQLISECSSILFFNSFGIDNVSVGILSPSVFKQHIVNTQKRKINILKNH